MTITIGDYLLQRLNEVGIQQIFGVPGDYNLGFLDRIVEHPDLKWIGCCNELNAAYASDGYARVNGMGALVTTFGVGELSAVNGIAGSYAELVPVIKIVGAPALTAQKQHELLHHTLGTGDFKLFADMYTKITTYHACLTPDNAAEKIDHAIRECYIKKRPVYLSLPSDIVHMTITPPQQTIDLTYPLSNKDSIEEIIERINQLMQTAKHPVILADMCAVHFPMQPYIERLLAETGIPLATMNLAKGIINESHPQYIGMYSGNYSTPGVQERVESADLILSFGSLFSDFNTGEFSTKIDTNITIEFHSDHVKFRHAIYPNIYFSDMLPALIKALKNYQYSGSITPLPIPKKFHATENKLTHQRLWAQVNTFLKPNSILIIEVGTSMFGAVQMHLPDNVKYINQCLWASIGYSVGALLGAQLAAPDKRILLFVGDGSFQLTAQEVSTMLRHKLTPIIFLINNNGYTIERVIHGPTMEYNDIQPWDYAALPALFGSDVWSTKVATEHELARSLEQAEQQKDKLVFIEILMDLTDAPEILRKIGEACAKQNRY